MAAQVSPDLLQHQLGRLRPQHGARAALVGFEFVEGELDLPALDVGRGKLGGRIHLQVGDAGEQPVVLGVIAAVIDGVVDLRYSPRSRSSSPRGDFCTSRPSEPPSMSTDRPSTSMHAHRHFVRTNDGSSGCLRGKMVAMVRSLSPRERAALDALVSAEFSGVGELRAQAQTVFGGEGRHGR